MCACRDVVQPTPCVPGLRVTQVAAGGMHSSVLTDTGEVTPPLRDSDQIMNMAHDEEQRPVN